MLRARLIWFAAGAAASSFIFILAYVFDRQEREIVPILVVQERLDAGPESEAGPLNGKMLSECGAKVFEMDGIWIGAKARLPITKENGDAIQCVLKRSAQEKFAVTLKFSSKLRIQEP